MATSTFKQNSLTLIVLRFPHTSVIMKESWEVSHGGMLLVPHVDFEDLENMFDEDFVLVHLAVSHLDLMSQLPLNTQRVHKVVLDPPFLSPHFTGNAALYAGVSLGFEDTGGIAPCRLDVNECSRH